MKNLLFTALSKSASSVADISENYYFLKTITVILFAVSAVLIIGCIFLKIFIDKKAKAQALSKSSRIMSIVAFALTGVVLACTNFSVFQYARVRDEMLSSSSLSSSSQLSESVAVTPVKPEPKPEPLPVLSPYSVEESNPSNWRINWEVMSNGAFTSNFVRPSNISFGAGKDYAKVEGIVTFRGNNYRSGGNFGTAKITNKTLTQKWRSSVGALNKWGGCGWTGQPLVVRWDKETKAIMNMYADKKAKDNLVEAIYATLDGKIYFYDMEDGSYTRDPINVGMNFKGAGALDPRGYPLMYVGSGLYNNGKAPRIYVISLIEGKIIYEQSGVDSFWHRRWGAFDGSPLVSAETDTLIWPCESGVIYTIKLNTVYDKAAGTISVNPQNIAKARYRTNTGKTLGFESSVVGVGGYLFAADNGGMVFCINANTMKLVWAQNVRDDVNSTPVFEWGEDRKGYLYVATSMEYGGGNSYIYKLDATTGKIIWERAYNRIRYDKEVSGGILGSPLLGKEGTDLEGLIIYPVGKTNMSNAGTLVALDTATGKTVWEKSMRAYAWSSPTAVYTDNGNGYIVLGSSAGSLYLLDPKTGETINSIDLGGTIESSPVIFENTIILGTRSRGVYGIEIS